MSVKKAPAPQNYQPIAAQQMAANRPNQQTPTASTQWTREDVGPAPRPTGNPQQDIRNFAEYNKRKENAGWTQSTGYAGGLGDAATGLVGQAGQMATPLDWSQFGALGTGDEAREQAIQAHYGQATKRLDPMFAQREDQMRTQLINQGLDPNSQAFRAAMTDLSSQRNDAYSNAMNSSIMHGQAAGDSVFRNNLQARQQVIAEALKQRGMPIDELRGMQQLLMAPGFAQDGSGLQAAIAQDQARLGAWDAQNKANADFWGGAMTLGMNAPKFF